MKQDLSQRKAALRQELKARRAQLPVEQRRAEDRAVLGRLMQLASLQRAQRVFCFISHGDEVDTRALIDELMRAGKSIVVPRITSQGMIAVPFTGWEELRPGQLGIPTPVSEQDCGQDIDVCITPGLAFTATGLRLGYGRGYYDRWFAVHPVDHRIGIGYDCQVVDELPVDDDDVPVTMLITGQRRIACGS